jgi:hypothetical protein
MSALTSNSNFLDRMSSRQGFDSTSKSKFNTIEQYGFLSR